MGNSPKVSEKKIREKFAEIAFAAETKDSDRLRALDWLANYLSKEKDTSTVLERLDAVLEEIRGSSEKEIR